jgi:chemotaxis protein methyltransferase CheR
MSGLAARAGLVVDDDYALFCTGVQRLCKIDLSSYKRGQMERRVRSFAGNRGKPELLDYLALLAHDDGELEQFLEHVTINVSQLWRNPVHWETLADCVIPDLARSGRIRGWSAGCSYGAEVYTLAAICREVDPTVALEIRGTDIDEQIVAQARVGRFSESDMRAVPEVSRRRWFEQRADGWQVKRELLEVARFEAEDLLACEPATGAYDVICCRNTLIYFTEESRSALYPRLAGALRPGGWLMLGCTERIDDAKAYGLEQLHPFTYRKS